VISVKIKLKGAKVLRAGVTARHWAIGTTHIDLLNTKAGDGVRNSFTLASKGGGQTSVEYVYSAEDYKAHLRMMVQNDRNAALAAMSEVMHEQMVALSACEAEVARAARNEVIETANSRWLEAHGTEEAVAKIVHEGVSAIVAAIENPETPEEEEAA
jgi:hypothetical protein